MEEAFLRSYQEPGPRYLSLACMGGIFVMAGYYFIQATSGKLSYWGGVQTLRLALMALFSLICIMESFARTASPADRSLLDKGRNAGHAMLRILNSILDYTMLEGRNATVKESVVSLHYMCTVVVDLHAARLPPRVSRSRHASTR